MGFGFPRWCPSMHIVEVCLALCSCPGSVPCILCLDTLSTAFASCWSAVDVCIINGGLVGDCCELMGKYVFVRRNRTKGVIKISQHSLPSKGLSNGTESVDQLGIAGQELLFRVLPRPCEVLNLRIPILFLVDGDQSLLHAVLGRRRKGLFATCTGFF